ncbi:MAG: hypothetical protein BHW58_04795 [Azospirillum sp. 51_20]|nr:MAG: hypothetical protein BHW58_04795 [Azospirillum sp. 51_20]
MFGRMLQANPVIATVFAQFPADFLFDVKFGFLDKFKVRELTTVQEQSGLFAPIALYPRLPL